MKQTLLKNATIIPMSEGVKHFTGSILIENDTIKGIFKGDEKPPRLSEEQTHDLTGKAILPGFINGHLHSDFTVFRGLLDRRGLIEQYVASEKLYKLLNPEERHLVRLATYIEAVKMGNTFIMDHIFSKPVNIEELPFKEAGITGGVTLRIDDIDDKILMNFIDNETKPFLYMSAEEGLSGVLLNEHRAFRKDIGIPIYMHLSETIWRYQIAIKRFGMSPVKVLDEYGILDSEFVGVHCVWMDEQDIEIYAKSGGGVINTPVSEMKIADGVAPVPAFLKMGVEVGLGTDGALWNNSCDLIAEGKSLLLLQSFSERPGSISEMEVLQMLTSGGAKVLGIYDIVGSIDAGKRADFVIIDLNSINLQPVYNDNLDNLISNIVNCAGRENIFSVWSGGKEIVLGGEYLLLNEDDIIEGLNLLSRKLVDKINMII
jgi:5-methylthioadenosine/S-adenosylhomocysteine deaminase